MGDRGTPTSSPILVASLEISASIVRAGSLVLGALALFFFPGVPYVDG